MTRTLCPSSSRPCRPSTTPGSRWTPPGSPPTTSPSHQHQLQQQHLQQQQQQQCSGGITRMISAVSRDLTPPPPCFDGKNMATSEIGTIIISAVKRSIGSTTGCTITEKAPTRAFSWLQAATTASIFKTLLRHYAKPALNPHPQ